MSRTLKILSITFALILLVMYVNMFVSRMPDKGEGALATPKYHIQIVCGDLNSDFFAEFVKGAAQAESEMNVYVELVETDKWEVNSVPWLVRKGIYYGVDGIAFHSNDTQKVNEMLEEATENSAALVLYESDNSAATEVLKVGSDSYLMGYEAGKLALEASTGHCKAVLVIDSTKFNGEASEGSLKLQGVSDALAESGRGEVVDTYPLGNSVMGGDVLVTELLENREHFNTIICLNEKVTPIIGQRLLYHGLFREYATIGYGALPQTLDYIERGVINAVLLPDSYNIGYNTVASLVAELEGNRPENYYAEGMTTITRENVISFLYKGEGGK